MLLDLRTTLLCACVMVIVSQKAWSETVIDDQGRTKKVLFQNTLPNSFPVERFHDVQPISFGAKFEAEAGDPWKLCVDIIKAYRPIDREVAYVASTCFIEDQHLEGIVLVELAAPEKLEEFNEVIKKYARLTVQEVDLEMDEVIDVVNHTQICLGNAEDNAPQPATGISMCRAKAGDFYVQGTAIDPSHQLLSSFPSVQQWKTRVNKIRAAEQSGEIKEMHKFYRDALQMSAENFNQIYNEGIFGAYTGIWVLTNSFVKLKKHGVIETLGSWGAFDCRKSKLKTCKMAP